jgi:hypothetical protein
MTPNPKRYAVLLARWGFCRCDGSPVNATYPPGQGRVDFVEVAALK